MNYINKLSVKETAVYQLVPRNQTAWKRFYRAVKLRNEAYQGRENLTLQIRGNLEKTAKAIFTDFLEAKRTERLHKDGWFETSTALIMEATHSPRRTVIDHMHRLMDVGFITGKVQNLDDFSKLIPHNYFVKIHPDFYLPQKTPPG
jgi:hypothetical protein